MNTIGVFSAKKKDGTIYYRASITYKEKHISLGSFKTEEAAGASYALADEILRGEKTYLPEDYEKTVGQNPEAMGFDKWIMLLNLRKTGMYCKNPVYLYGKYFVYYLERNTELIFDADEFFFFRTHKIQKRGGHLFYNDFGMQCSLPARYGVKGFAVEGRDYVFKNGDNKDFRFGNLLIINKYNGVYVKEDRGRKKYNVKIHVFGNVSVGSYSNEVEAAIAYNKAADCLEEGIRKKKNREKEDVHSTSIENKILSFEENTDTNSAIFKEAEREDENYTSRIKRGMEGNPEGALFKGSGDKKRERKKPKMYRKWHRNYIENISGKEYITIYENIKFSKSFKKYLTGL